MFDMFGGHRMVQPLPGPIVGPIAMVFGYIIDFIFNFIYSITVNHSLGLSIILLTIIVRTLMVPLSVKQQKSMLAMQKLNPEIKKIRDKYAGTKDPEKMKEMNVAIQALYAKNKVNPLGGCLPMFVQMPLFFGLAIIMNQSHLYVRRLGDLYQEIASFLMTRLPAEVYYYTGGIMDTLSRPRLPGNWEELALNAHDPADVSRILNVFSADDWRRLAESVQQHVPEYFAYFQEMYQRKEAIEIFFGISLTEATGLGWPGVLIPILAVLTTLGTSWTMSKMTALHADERMRQQQKIMMIIMPIMMGLMTIGMPGGVGIYWITNSVFHIVQQVIFNQRAGIVMFSKKKA